MAWEVQVAWPLLASPDDRWQIVPIVLDVGVIAYGVRLITPSGLPPNWQVAGYWCWLQLAGGSWLHSEVHTIPLLRVAGQPVITVLGANQVDVLAVTPNVYAIGVSINRWIPRSDLEILVLKP